MIDFKKQDIAVKALQNNENLISGADAFIAWTNKEPVEIYDESKTYLSYKQNLEKIPALLEYRKAYQKKFMEVARSDNNKQLKKDFDSWKKIAQGKIKDYKQGKVTEDELYKWMIENK